ncbi:N-acetylneuraminate 9-O-acetyltransferase isoform X5 [Python bivittatus]|uniref:N-acetylneuraminate (7)9-O-acetyltransferase n=1 Tax=Python bivittatus TaxID=176946 RepID=A0A9F5IJQ4_PYTBI|nr:N-acetylneuraminate 9-O-acetyltransferase isoform X5 [Python bivittatus]
MAALAYSLGKREINHYFSVRSAKALALGAVLLFAACHAVSRRYQGNDTCEYLLSTGRFLGDKIWQPYSCMMHRYKQSEAKSCLKHKYVAFIGDSRIRQLFYSFVKLINPQIKEEGNKHENIPFEDKSSSLKVDFLWYPEVNGSMKQCIKSWTEGSSSKPHIIVAGAATWSIKIHNGSNEALTQYRINFTSIAPLLEKLAKSSDVYWVLQDPVYEDMLSESRKMITNEKIDAYNEAAVSILNSSSKNSKAKVKVFSASRLIAEETIIQSSDGLHLPESSRETTKVLNREQTDEWKGWMQLVILIYHISGASTFLPVYMHIRVLVAAYLFQTGYGHFSYFWIKGDFGIYRVCQVLFRLNFLVVVLCIVMDRSYQFYYFVPLVTFWFLVIYITLALWPQIILKKANGSFFWHSGLLIKLAFLFVCIYFLAYSEDLFEKVFSIWPLSKFFELNGSIYEWWFRWKLDRYVVFHGMLFAFIYLTFQKRQVLSEGKGEPLFPTKVSNILLFISVVFFLTYSIWASSCKNKTECNKMHPSVSVVQILAFILIRNTPGYARSVYSSFFAWFGRISLELFICQYHIWLSADTKGILVLIPGNPMLNIIVSTFIFVCVAHEIFQITNDLAQIVIPKDNVMLLKRLIWVCVFFSGFLFLSSFQKQ